MKNEQTSKRVAKIAAKIMANKRDLTSYKKRNPGPCVESIQRQLILKDVSANDLLALAASCLTQTANKKK